MAAKSLDCSDTVVTVRKRGMVPHHKTEAPQCCLVVNPAEPVASAIALHERIKAALYKNSCPVYLYIDKEMHAFLIPESRPIAQQWIKTHHSWFVAVYSFRRWTFHGKAMPMLRPSAAGVEEDLRDHLASFGWVL